MADLVHKFEPGEKDLSHAEAAKRGRALLGWRRNMWIEQRTPRIALYRGETRPYFSVGAFLTLGDKDMPEPYRKSVTLGEGWSWAEALARAESALRNKRVLL
jgi:hypothetical protein